MDNTRGVYGVIASMLMHLRCTQGVLKVFKCVLDMMEGRTCTAIFKPRCTWQ